MRITILTYVESKGDTHYDDVVPQVEAALRERDHDVSIVAGHDDVEKLIADLRASKPQIIFNLMETFADLPTADISIAGLLDLLGVPYTGSGPGELYITGDKSLSKKLLAFEGILYPRFAVFGQDAAGLETGGNLHMPLFVKPLRMDASIGIEDDKSLVRDVTSLMKRVSAIHQKVGDAALAEEYIEGRELYVGVLGNDEYTALPPVEVDFTGLPEGAPHVLGRKAKWEKRSAEYKGTKSVLAEIPDELRAKLQKVSIDAYRGLNVRDYGRVDLRLTETGDIYVIEVNANCYLEQKSEFAMSAEAAGLDYPTLIDRIVDLAVSRQKRERR